MDINAETVTRAWKDPAFAEGLPPEVREAIPAAPEGASDMTDEQLAEAAGGCIFPGPIGPIDLPTVADLPFKGTVSF